VELCRNHEIGVELIHESRDLGQVLDRTLAECERRIHGGAARADDRLRQLEGLVLLARTTRFLQVRGTELDDARSADQALDRVDHELRVAQARSEALQRELENTVSELDHGAPSSPVVDAERLGELFDSVSKLCHKINNPLTSLMGRAQMMEFKVKQGADEQLAKSVGVIQDSAKRVASLIQELANLVCQSRKELVETYDSSNGSR
jgi:signal transduction histidine kinase